MRTTTTSFTMIFKWLTTCTRHRLHCVFHWPDYDYYVRCACILCVLCDENESHHIAAQCMPFLPSCLLHLDALPIYFPSPMVIIIIIICLQDYTFQSVLVCRSVHACEMRICRIVSKRPLPNENLAQSKREMRLTSPSHHITKLEINTNVNLYFLHFRPIILHSVHHAFDSQKKIHK